MGLSVNDLARTRRFLADNGANEQQTITLTNVTGGTFTLTWNGQTTSSLAYNATAAQVQSALVALPAIGLGNVLVNNTNPWLVTFVSNLGYSPQPLIQINGAGLTGTNIQTLVQEVTPGGLTAFTDAELSDNYTLAGNNLFRGIAYGFFQLQSNAAKFSDYTAGQTSEHKEQVYQHLKDLADMFIQWSQAQNQAIIVGMMPVPPRWKARPYYQGGFGSVLGGWLGLPPLDWIDQWMAGSLGQ